MPVLHLRYWSLLTDKFDLAEFRPRPRGIGDARFDRVIGRHSIMEYHFQRGTYALECGRCNR